jgi:ApaG protein
MADSKRYEVTVTTVVRFLAEQSDPAKNQYVFSYTIKITNIGDVEAQLLSRHWFITDGDHKVQEVKGLGVVGQQPTLKPGESFEYTSGASIPTAVGTMQGSYQMMAVDGRAFDAPIPLFTLSVPRTLH